MAGPHLTAKVLAFVMNDASFLRRVRELAKDSANVIITDHAKQRMRERGVLRTQVQHVLLRGSISEPAHLDIHRCWKATIQATVSGDRVGVVAALGEDKNENSVVVVTVMRGG